MVPLFFPVLLCNIQINEKNEHAFQYLVYLSLFYNKDRLCIYQDKKYIPQLPDISQNHQIEAQINYFYKCLALTVVGVSGPGFVITGSGLYISTLRVQIQALFLLSGPLRVSP